MSLNQAKVNAFQTLAFGSISGAYAPVGIPISLPVFLFRLVNGTNGDMIFSIDGVTDQFIVPSASSVVYNIAANHSLAQSFALPGHVQFYVRQSVAPTSGSVYVESISPNLKDPSLL